ncbi:MAG: hypothetical protein IT453_10400 [Planctomycetes bacterium]|nr:hypothetical protein [Planctomycetota bacterium]
MADEPKNPPPSWGNIGEHHWSRTRKGANREALDYYRERSKAPGVEGGGTARNFYCMQCDGVIPYEHEGPVCPHCGAALEDRVKRYFNWVEINEPAGSDALALVKLGLPIALGLAAVAALVWWWLA